jgi:hypothetical protein
MSNGTQTYLDDCTRADENPLSNGGAWSAVTGYSALKLLSNNIEASVISTNCAMRVSTFSAGDDQYAEVVTNHTLTGTDAVHLWVRANSDRTNVYLLKLAVVGSSAIIKVVSGAATTLATLAGVTPAVGDRFRITVVGSQITVTRNFLYIQTVQDADVTTGLPGLYMFAATLANATVTEFRAGSPVGNVGGPWTKQGSIIHATTTDINSHLLFSGISNQSLMYDNNVQLIPPNSDGKVFKIWFMAGNSITYAESNTCLQGSWTRQTVASLAGLGLPRIYRDGSTYYAYVSHTPTVWTHVDLYTCTNGDNNWTLVQADIIVSGGAGSWDESQAAYFSIVGQIAGTWYALYNGLSAAGVYGMGLATASALAGPWTKYGSNPVVTRVGTPEHMVLIGGYWYGWLANSTSGASNIVRMRTQDFITWDPVKVVSIQPENAFEGINTAGSGHGSIAVPSVVEANGTSYMLYSNTTSDATAANGYVVCLATAPYSIAQLVATGEEYFASQPVAFTDTFNRANGGLGANYTTEAGSNAHQIVSNVVEPTALNVTSRSLYTGASPALNAAQFTEITFTQLLTGAFANPLVRMATGAVTHYAASVGGPTGSNFNVNVDRIVSGGVTILGGFNLSIPIAVGDVFRLRAMDITNNGVLVSLYQNGNLIIEVTDFNTAPIASGNPGFGSFAQTAGALTDSKISQFRAGNANVTYVPVSLGGMPTTITITMKDGSTVVVTIPNGYTASQYIQALRLSGGVFSQTAVDPGTGAQWWPYRAWQKALTS